MPFSATVYNVLIASPSDVPDERIAIARALQDWNSLNSENEGKVLLPVMWETHSTPAMGDRPQGLINDQVVRGCDILIGAFWTRFGSPTGVEESGTVEEIRWFLNNKKPTMLYFSKAQVDIDSVDWNQYSKLKEFKKSVRDKGIQEDYRGCDELRQKLSRHLTIVMREMITGPSLDKHAVQAARASGRADSKNISKNEVAQIEVAQSVNSKDKIWLEEYTDKAFVIRGDVRTYKDELKKASGRWINCRDKSKAWMFSKRHINKVADIIGVDPILRPRANN